jgi:nicotinate-nucleotide adenylyltransferase
MKAGIFGGTFDPVHFGHLITTQFVREIRKLDKVIFIPAFISPHKTDKVTSGAADRLNMIKLAIADIPYFEYSDIEINNSVVSYTIDTLEKLRNRFDEIELIIGYDNICKFDTWKDPDKIFSLSKVVVMKRKTEKETVHKNKYMETAEYIETPLIEISSTQIRQRVQSGLPIDFLVPEKVKNYILSNNLYKE